ncbi:hypothetical protein E2562_037245 [Oryza meyeriana var. granulata]|uniref:Uncharacterized protein n=1 Tax=Oryza meyeriana var. granulata TaxID=110450 RepID=A0A6G1DSV4_9ORYZ|nr:hypothetical protein E2562_037245 [Oryza meyeriana var. granulata]
MDSGGRRDWFAMTAEPLKRSGAGAAGGAINPRAPRSRRNRGHLHRLPGQPRCNTWCMTLRPAGRVGC